MSVTGHRKLNTPLMSSRDERMGPDEVVPGLNEEIEAAYESEPPPTGSTWCANAHSRCATAASTSRWTNTCSPDHFIGDSERIVHENDRFAVVAKREGMRADVARDEIANGRRSLRTAASGLSRIERALALTQQRAGR